MPRSRRSPVRAWSAPAAVIVLAAALVGGTASAAHADELTVTDYAGLSAALSPPSPLTEPRTVVLGADIVGTVASGLLDVVADAPITLDLNGHDLDLDGAAGDLAVGLALAAGADLTITDTSATPGTLTAAGPPGFAGIRTTDAALTITGAAIVVARGGGIAGGSTAVGSGAGIGGDGDGGDAGSLTVGGTAQVTATGGAVSATGNNYAGAGAGIGGGGVFYDFPPVVPGGAGGAVVVRDRAVVTATGGGITAAAASQAGAGAGIGGGGGALGTRGGAGGSVAIEGAAQVAAQGGSAVGGAFNVGGGGAGVGAGGQPDTIVAAAGGGTASVFVIAGLSASAGTGRADKVGAPATLTQAYPQLTAVTPAAGIPGDALAIDGSGLAFATEVAVGGVAAPFAVVDDAGLTATAPAGSGTGLAVAVTIAAPGGDPSYTVTLPEAFSYQTPPVAGDVAATVGYDSPGTAIAPDAGPLDPPITAIAVASAPAHGMATVDGDHFVYTPQEGYSGTDSFTYTATSRAGTSAPATVSITVEAPVLAIAPATLPAATVGAAYSATLTTTGGAAPYRYRVSAGAFPDGILLGPSGALSGTPTTTGAFSFTVTVEDSGTGTTGTATADYRITVAPALAGTGAEPPLAAGAVGLVLLLGGAAIGLGARRRSRRPRIV